MIIVLGQPRTGTSLLMQMLHVAGADCLGEWPAFEPLELTPAFCDVNTTLKTLHENQVAKVNWFPGLTVPPSAKLILTCRDAFEQAHSECKMMVTTLPVFAHRHMGGAWVSPASTRILDWQVRMMHETRDHDRILISFEDSIEEPEIVARVLSMFVGQGEPEKMAKCVVQRSPECYSGMLEFDLAKTEAPT